MMCQRWRWNMNWKIFPQPQVKKLCALYPDIFFPLCLHFSLESVVRCCFSFLFCAGRKRGAWSLVCDTEEQWLSLAESIKDKTSPQDRHLYRVISQNFLPEISNMIEHKVRHQRHHHQSPLHQHTTPSMRPLFLIGCRFVNMKAIIHRL